MECSWPGDNPLMQTYHNEEWGRSNTDGRYLFEFLTLEGAQAGLSWSIVLSKREAYQQAFNNFDIEYCANLTDEDLTNIKTQYNVIKHFAKLQSVRSNAQAILELRKEYDHFSDFLWQYVDAEPIINHWDSESQIPTQTSISQQLSKDFKKRGFKFVGPVITYAFMQAVGMVDDHLISCPYHTDNRSL